MIKIKCNFCDKQAVVMEKGKNGGKKFYCINHYAKEKKKNERKKI